jgi:hypothetical protein
MHSSDFSSLNQRMTSVRTPPLCADHFRLSSLFGLSTVELYRSPAITAQTLSASHGSFQSSKIFPVLPPANHLQQISHHVICMSNHAAACTYPGFSLVVHLCGPPCLSPRLASHQARDLNRNLPSSECSSDTTYNQSN